jgi:hypothetical protein
MKPHGLRQRWLAFVFRHTIHHNGLFTPPTPPDIGAAYHRFAK